MAKAHSPLRNPASTNPWGKMRARLCTWIFAVVIFLFVLGTLKNTALDFNRLLNPLVPRAKRLSETKVIHGIEVTDDYSWLRQIDEDPDVRSYVAAENRYASFVLSPTRRLRKSLATELQNWNEAITQHEGPEVQLKCKSDLSPPNNFFEIGAHLYWSDVPPGKLYPVYYRRLSALSDQDSCACLASITGNSTVILDYNDLVQAGAEFTEGVFEPHPNRTDIIAFSFDLTGSENFQLYVKNLETGRLSKPIGQTYYSARWGTGQLEKCLHYNAVDPIWGIPRKVFQSCTWDSDGGEKHLYTEEDVSLTTELVLTADGEYLYIKAAGQITSETLVLNEIGAALPLFRRIVGVHYHVEHHRGRFYVLTNARGASNYQVVSVDAQTALKSDLTIEELVAGGLPKLKIFSVLKEDAHEVIERIEITKTHLIAWVRSIVTGLRTFRLLALDKADHNTAADTAMQLGTAGYSVFPGTISDMESRLHRSFSSPCFVFSNSSFLSPNRVWALSLRSGKTSLLVETRVTGFDPAQYVEERMWAPSAVNASIRIPMSLVRRKDFVDSRHPLLLSAYGAYGTYTDPAFSVDRLPLLHRGISYALCHPRGDGNLGPGWYTGGKYEQKHNTLDDVGSCLRTLVDRGVTKAGRVAFHGRSAGGLVAGHVVNNYGWADGKPSHPDAIVRCVVAQVPFIDPIGDMMDESIPWTPYEFFEWGNPITSATIFHAMRAYSPYGQIPAAASFPALHVSTGLADPRVGFWEPIKWVAKLRTRYEDLRQKELVLRVGVGGHFSGDKAEWFAFVIHQLGLN
ncbi:hypothetical protein HDU87_005624 [Geranomyces variabilis]|uniref:Prolyl endopeptidase n=1 Tax=Geranomyces variabilis TaxID=109894 RepID=A0AAD5TGJ7_9FUNG|nr:hypothetical protein HDU87_005624 [Geranomyces variabilis]